MKKSIVIDKYQINFTCQYGYYPNSISIENGCRISYFNVVKIDEYKKAKNYYTYPIVKNYSIEYVKLRDIEAFKNINSNQGL